MAIEDIVNVSDVVEILPSELASKVGFLVNVLQALGIFIIAYLVFQIITAILDRKRNKKIDNLLDSVDSMNKNLIDIKKILKNKKY